MKTILVLMCTCVGMLGCKTYEIDSIYKKADRSLVLREPTYQRFKLEPKVEVEIYKPPTTAAGRLSTQASSEKNTRLSQTYKEIYEETITSMFSEVGLERNDINYDILIEYLILFNSARVTDLKSDTFGVYNLRGVDKQSGELIFEVTGKLESSYKMNKATAKEVCIKIFSELDIFN